MYDSIRSFNDFILLFLLSITYGKHTKINVIRLGGTMPININKNTTIISASLVNTDTKEESALFERKGSSCHFRKEIFFGDNVICLRIHWRDINKNGDPVLDADIYENISGEKGKKIKNKKSPWHHTEKTYDEASNSKIYKFEFKGLDLPLMLTLSVAKGVNLDAILEKS